MEQKHRHSQFYTFGVQLGCLVGGSRIDEYGMFFLGSAAMKQ